MEDISFIEDDGWYVLDNVHYESIKGLVHSGIFGFCGCVEEDVTSVVLINRLKELANDWPNHREAWNKEHNSLFYFIEQKLDDAGLIEHGSAIRCSWINDKGREFLSLYGDVFNDE